MVFSLAGLNCIISGATSGIGYAVAQRFSACGANVAIVGRRASEQLAKSAGAKLHVVADCSREDSIHSAFEQAHRLLGPLDIIINNAGRMDSGASVENVTSEQMSEVFAVNTFGVLYGMKHGQKYCNDGASIINTASISGLTGLAGNAPYNASKAAVISLTQVAALELAHRRIRVNAVCPGSFLTEMVTAESPEVPLVEIMCPMGRVGHTDDIVGVYHFLAARESAYVTGQTLVVDGGMMAGISTGTIEAVFSSRQT